MDRPRGDHSDHGVQCNHLCHASYPRQQESTEEANRGKCGNERRHVLFEPPDASSVAGCPNPRPSKGRLSSSHGGTQPGRQVLRHVRLITATGCRRGSNPPEPQTPVLEKRGRPSTGQYGRPLRRAGRLWTWKRSAKGSIRKPNPPRWPTGPIRPRADGWHGTPSSTSGLQRHHGLQSIGRPSPVLSARSRWSPHARRLSTPRRLHEGPSGHARPSSARIR